MARLADLTITVGLDAATAALAAIRDATAENARPRDEASRIALLREVHAIAAATLKKAQAKPRVRHA
jgi:hypothetical protein